MTTSATQPRQQKASAQGAAGPERLGAHVSTAGGPATAPARGAAIGATAIQIFTKTPNMWREPRGNPGDRDRLPSRPRYPPRRRDRVARFVPDQPGLPGPSPPGPIHGRLRRRTASRPKRWGWTPSSRTPGTSSMTTTPGSSAMPGPSPRRCGRSREGAGPPGDHRRRRDRPGADLRGAADHPRPGGRRRPPPGGVLRGHLPPLQRRVRPGGRL